jgi:predicted transposase YdaD
VGPDSNMGRRMWEYNVEASIKYEQPVQSAVIYLRKPGSSKAKSPYQVKLPNGKVVHEFSFSVIELCKMEAEQLFQTGLKGLLPLVPLTQDGQQHDVVERVIDELQQPGVKKSGDLLSLTYNLAGLVFEGESEQLWLVRRFEMLKDILEESWTYQRIKEEGREEGLEQGLEKGLQAQRQSLILLIQKHYPALVQLAEDVCNAIRILEELQDLFQKVLLAKNEQEVHQHLLSAQK